MSRDGRQLLYTTNQEGCVGLVWRELVSGNERALTISDLDFAAPTGRVRLAMRGQGTGKPLIARVALASADESWQAPPESLWRVQRDIGHFYVRESVEFELPAGTYSLRAWHGPEYRRADKDLDVIAGRTTEHVISLDRWIDANARGWYSGDNHIHANYGYGEYYNSPATMAEMGIGEDLNVCNFMVANSDGDGVYDREYFRGAPDPLSTGHTTLYWNEEFRSTLWGHLTLVNLKHVVEPIFTGFKDTTNTYDIPLVSEITWKTHRQGGLANYTHPATRLDDPYLQPYSAKGLPVYAAIDKIDTVDIMGMGGDQASIALYHRLLNCGLRLGASAGTDCFLNRIDGWLPGGARVYVHVEAPFSYEKWIAGLRAGRSFASNGPILSLSVNDQPLGSTIELSAPEQVRVQAEATSQFPLHHLEILYNGHVVAAAKPANDTGPTRIDASAMIDHSGWLALRAIGNAVADVRAPPFSGQTVPSPDRGGSRSGPAVLPADRRPRLGASAIGADRLTPALAQTRKK